MDDAICGRCDHQLEDKNHVFFDCKLSKEVCIILGLRILSATVDNDVWALPSNCQQDPVTWPSISIFLTFLWRV
jgi:hypothetical protein